MNIAQLNRRGPRTIPKSAISKMETMLFTREDATSWIVPPFQRPLRVNDKVRAVAEELKANGGFIAGVLTLGRLHNDKGTYIVDGQHRIEAFKISELREAIADVRTVTFDNMADMAEEFVLLQQSLVRMRPDDILRGIEASTRSLKIIRETCPFVGYGLVTRNGSQNSPVISMAVVLRYWVGSEGETPVANKTGSSSAQTAHEIDDLEVTSLCKFLHVAHAAWGRDPSYGRLWGGLNIGLCMWMYRRLVLEVDRTGKRAVILNTEQFKKCLMSVSADSEYIDWLSGRTLSDHHRMPCYRRLRAIFAARLKEDGIDAPKFPKEAWTVS